MPDIGDPAAPWLVGLIACPTALEVAAVRDALTERGLRTRSVPSGRAKLSWTCVAGGSTLALVVTGRGAEGARQGASFWMPRSRRVVSLGAALTTGLVDPPAIVIEGDETLVGRVRTRERVDDPPLVPGRIAATESMELGPAAEASLSAAGYAAAAPEHAVWAQAAGMVSGRALALAALTGLPPLPPALAQLDRTDRATRPPLRMALALARHPGARRLLQAHDAALRAALRPAARLAVDVLLDTA